MTPIAPAFDWTCKMNEDAYEVARNGRYIYRRRYFDEEAWEPVGVDTVRRHALAEVHRDVLRAPVFLYEAGNIRTRATLFEAKPAGAAES